MILLYRHQGRSVLTVPGWMTGALPVPAGATLLRAFPHYLYYRSMAAFLNAFPQMRVDAVYAFSMGGQIVYRLLKEGLLRAGSVTFSGVPCVTPPWLKHAPETIAFAEQAQRRPARTLAFFRKQCLHGHHDSTADIPPPAHIARTVPRYWFRALYYFTPDTVMPPLSAHIIHGEQDAVIPVEQALQWQRIFPNARISLLPHTGHVPVIPDNV